ncbi:alpha amylase C-terminal domain-containing protein, partial [Salmonella enterica]|uniref:alpha amylase C-terminal domain-containing protein n=1 Tax=Salmonella enterica TaxID=28901 RepID=UPI003CF089DA
ANKDILVFERQFGQNVVLVAVNKSDDTPATLDTITADLPPGNYSDALKSIQNGPKIAVSANGAVRSFTMPPKSTAVWS